MNNGHSIASLLTGGAPTVNVSSPASQELPSVWASVPPPLGNYRCLVVDPPWPQRKTGQRKCRPNQGTRLDYPTVEKCDLLALPVQRWASDADPCFLWLWTTNSKDRVVSGRSKPASDGRN